MVIRKNRTRNHKDISPLKKVSFFWSLIIRLVQCTGSRSPTTSYLKGRTILQVPISTLRLDGRICRQQVLIEVSSFERERLLTPYSRAFAGHCKALSALEKAELGAIYSMSRTVEQLHNAFSFRVRS